MSEDPSNLADSLDPYIAAWQARPVPNGPSSAMVSSITQTVHNLAVPARPWGNRLKRFAAAGSLAAAFLLVGVLLFFSPWLNKAAALDRSLQKVGEIDFVRFEITMTIEGQVQPPNQVTVRGNKYRIDGIGGHLNWVLDRDVKAGLILEPRAAKFQTIDISNGFIAPVEVVGMNIRDQLMALRGQKVEAVGSELINGMLADKFSLKAGKAFHLEGDWVIWIGRKSGLPVKVMVETVDNQRPMSRVYSAFDWAPVTDSSTFSTDPPPNFTEAVILNLFPALPSRKK